MSGQRRKSFTFDEEDMEWINPLILEWVKENEGKKQSDFVKELMTDYRTRRDSAPEEGALGRVLPSGEGIRDHVERISLGETYDKLGSRLDGLLDTLKGEHGKLVARVKELEAGARLRKALSDFSEELRPRLDRLLVDVKRKIRDLTEAVGKMRTYEH